MLRNVVLTEDVTWRGEILVEGDATVAPQATLTIEPGTYIRFRSAGEGQKSALLVQGRISAIGTADRPVVISGDFTPFLAGDWQGIVLLATEKNNLLEHCRIQGAEIGLEASFSRIVIRNVDFATCRTGASFHDSLVTITGGGARDCVAGVRLSDSEADIREANFSANGNAIIAVASSLAMEGATLFGNEQTALSAEKSRVRVRGSSFSVNGNGLKFNGCEGSVIANRILNNRAFGLEVASSRLKISSNDISGNGKVGLRVEGGRSMAWGNVFSGNTGYDIQNSGTEEFTAIGNWWGGIPDTDILSRIFGGSVRVLPPLRERPAAVPPVQPSPAVR
ncbi:Right handed beta helix region [Geobacter sp. DSM 9736]|nr:Right handed beta helix region [Geobacter sp. DSM 9736]